MANWQPIKIEKSAIFLQTNLLCRAAVRNGLQYPNYDFNRLNRINFSTFCTILVILGPVIPEFTRLTIRPFAAIRQKSAYHAKYLRISWTDLDLLYRFGRRIAGDDYPNIHLAVAQGTLLWQPVKFGRCSHTSPRTTLIYSLLRRSTIDWQIVNPLSKDSMAIIRLHHVQIWWTSIQ